MVLRSFAAARMTSWGKKPSRGCKTEQTTDRWSLSKSGDFSFSSLESKGAPSSSTPSVGLPKAATLSPTSEQPATSCASIPATAPRPLSSHQLPERSTAAPRAALSNSPRTASALRERRGVKSTMVYKWPLLSVERETAALFTQTSREEAHKKKCCRPAQRRLWIA